MENLKLFVFLAVLGSLEAKIIPGHCPTVSTQLDFDPMPVSIVKPYVCIRWIELIFLKSMINE